MVGTTPDFLREDDDERLACPFVSTPPRPRRGPVAQVVVVECGLPLPTAPHLGPGLRGGGAVMALAAYKSGLMIRAMLSGTRRSGPRLAQAAGSTGSLFAM